MIIIGISFLSVLLVAILITGFSIPAYSEYMSPKKQLESGVLAEDIQCRDDRVLVLRTNGSPACVSERNADRMGWEIIQTEFNITIDIITDPVIEKQQTEKLLTQNVEQELMFAISSDKEFVGELYGYYDPESLRRPAPKEMSVYFANDHYDVKQDVQDSSALLKSGELTTNSLLEQLVTSNSVHVNVIDYTNWIPTYIPDGFELKWIDINQPEIYGDDIGRLDFRYYVNTVEVSADTTTSEISDIPGFQVSIRVYDFDDDPFSQERIDRVTKDGTSTQVFIEEKYGGIFETLIESPIDHNVSGVALYGHEYQINVGGRGLPLDEFEKIFLDIFERQ